MAGARYGAASAGSNVSDKLFDAISVNFVGEATHAKQEAAHAASDTDEAKLARIQVPSGIEIKGSCQPDVESKVAIALDLMHVVDLGITIVATELTEAKGKSEVSYNA